MLYKTFSPYIDESYDEIIDDKERIGAITKEIERLKDLPDKDYIDVIEGIQSIVEHNFKIFVKAHKENSAKEKYPCLEGIVPILPPQQTLPTLIPEKY